MDKLITISELKKAIEGLPDDTVLHVGIHRPNGTIRTYVASNTCFFDYPAVYKDGRQGVFRIEGLAEEWGTHPHVGLEEVMPMGVETLM